MVEKYSKLNPLKLGLACAIITFVIVFFVSVAKIFGFMGGFPLWNMLLMDIYGTLYLGTAWADAILSSLYAAIDCFIISVVFVWIYNKLL